MGNPSYFHPYRNIGKKTRKQFKALQEQEKARKEENAKLSKMSLLGQLVYNIKKHFKF